MERRLGVIVLKASLAEVDGEECNQTRGASR